MKKECTCIKIVKDDKVTVLYKCKVCKKHDIFDKSIELAKAIIELHTTKNVPVPKYKKPRATESDHKEYQDWLNGISDKNTQRDFNKGMLEADKELQKVCEKPKNIRIINEVRLVYQDWEEDQDEKTGWSGFGWQFKDDDQFIDDSIWGIIETLDNDKYYNPILAIAEKTTEIHI